MNIEGSVKKRRPQRQSKYFSQYSYAEKVNLIKARIFTRHHAACKICSTPKESREGEDFTLFSMRLLEAGWEVLNSDLTCDKCTEDAPEMPYSQER